MSTASPPPVDEARQFRVLALALVTAPLVVLLAVAFAVTPAEEDLPVAVAAAAIAVVAAGWVLAQVRGYRVAPLAPGEDRATALARFRESMVLRFVLTEAPIILGLAAAFVLPYGIWTYAAVLVVGLPSMLLHVWPSRRVVDRVATRLESGGVPSGLRETFGHR
ncbi:MAG: hypothetical protein P1U38_06860 [Aeromicrobium sp.]|uniref:hypothetical protein n=1 Tax=Aeromicrobium sp. TaxID=1871063 RepID=UPI0025B80AC2|nr:hypothetical protein [Aeromicrobium sp.]MCK5891378.1 hypothetical protein [Aeromicrobium sp.]MDF1704476.1 hypothetical protein [Aeromicrobium sp.]